MQQIKYSHLPPTSHVEVSSLSLYVTRLTYNHRYIHAATYYLYSGNSLYLLNSCSHSSCDLGGRIPFTRCHFVIDSPDSVSLVIPPSTTAPPTSPQHPASHHPTTRFTPPFTPCTAEEGKHRLGKASRWGWTYTHMVIIINYLCVCKQTKSHVALGTEFLCILSVDTCS